MQQQQRSIRRRESFGPACASQTQANPDRGLDGNHRRGRRSGGAQDAGSPTEPTRQQTNIELLVVIATIKTDGMPVIFTASVPAKDVKTLKANLRVGRDGNLMDVDWGNGPQAPQDFRIEVGNSNTAYDSIATMVRQAKPGEVLAFHALQEVDAPK